MVATNPNGHSVDGKSMYSLRGRATYYIRVTVANSILVATEESVIVCPGDQPLQQITGTCVHIGVAVGSLAIPGGGNVIGIRNVIYLDPIDNLVDVVE